MRLPFMAAVWLAATPALAQDPAGAEDPSTTTLETLTVRPEHHSDPEQRLPPTGATRSLRSLARRAPQAAHGRSRRGAQVHLSHAGTHRRAAQRPSTRRVLASHMASVAA